MNQDQGENNINVPKDSESFGNIPKLSETTSGKLRNISETFGNIPKLSEKTEHHTLTVREAAKLFEEVSIPRTERSIINWCNPNKQGVPRLDCYFDPNDRKYFITPESVNRVIGEEINRSRAASVIPNVSEEKKNISEAFGIFPKADSETFRSFPNYSESPFGNVRNDAESNFGNSQKNTYTPPQYHDEKAHTESSDDEKAKRIKELEQENLDLKITNRGKDYFIDELKNDRARFREERERLIEQLVSSTKQIGVLETKLLQLEGPKERVNDIKRWDDHPSETSHSGEDNRAGFSEHRAMRRIYEDEDSYH